MNKRDIKNYVKMRYGVEIPDDVEFVIYNDKIRVARKDVINFSQKNEIFEKNFYNLILFARLGKDIKLTTNAMQIFLKDASRNVVILRGDKVKDFVSGLDVIPDEMIDCKEGYVVVRSDTDILGCGLLKKTNEWVVKNQIPKSRRIIKPDF